MHRFTTGDYLLKTTKDRILLITSKTRLLQLKGETAHTPYLGGLAQILGRWRCSVNICCLNSGWGSFSKRKSDSSLGTMQAWFPTGEPIHGCGSCPPTSLPTGFSKWGLDHISHAWNGSPYWRTEHGDTEDYCQALKPNEITLAGFQTCLGKVIPLFFPLPPFWNGNDYPMPVPPLHFKSN